MKQNHVILIRVTKDFKQIIELAADREKYASVCQYIKDTLYKNIYKTDRMERLCRLLENDERNKHS